MPLRRKPEAGQRSTIRTYLLQNGFVRSDSLARVFEMPQRDLLRLLRAMREDGLVSEDARGWFAAGNRPGDRSGLNAGIDGGKWRASSASYTRGYFRRPR